MSEKTEKQNEMDAKEVADFLEHAVNLMFWEKVQTYAAIACLSVASILVIRKNPTLRKYILGRGE